MASLTCVATGQHVPLTQVDVAHLVQSTLVGTFFASARRLIYINITAIQLGLKTKQIFLHQPQISL